MDYVNLFETNSSQYLENNPNTKIKISSSPSLTQRRTDFEQALESVVKKIEVDLHTTADKLSDLAYSNGYPDIANLRVSLNNSIRSIRRDFIEKQREKSGLYPD